MKIEEIKTIVKLMSENDLTEFKIESEEMTLCLRRGTAASAPVVVQAPVAAPVAPVSAPSVAPAAVSAAPQSAAAVNDPAKVIESPIVGTFYRSSSPGGDPLVKVGTKVDADTTVCIVEAMKVMNEIKAEKSGVIREVLVENGQSVEYGQPLFIIE